MGLGALGKLLAKYAPKAVPLITRLAPKSSTVWKGAATVAAVDLVALPVLSEATDGGLPAPRLLVTATQEAAESVGRIFSATQVGLLEGSVDQVAQEVEKATGVNGVLVLGGVAALVVVLLLAIRR
jgi:hypothetical protein